MEVLLQLQLEALASVLLKLFAFLVWFFLIYSLFEVNVFIGFALSVLDFSVVFRNFEYWSNQRPKV